MLGFPNKDRGYFFMRESDIYVARFFSNVKFICDSRKISLRRMASDLKTQGIKIYPSRISDYRNGRVKNASISYCLIFCHYLDVDLTDMLSIDYSLLGSDSAQI